MPDVVCLSIVVCLLATLCRNYWWELHENFASDVSVDKKALINLWKSSASASRSRNFFKDFLTLREKVFVDWVRLGKDLGSLNALVYNLIFLAANLSLYSTTRQLW